MRFFTKLLSLYSVWGIKKQNKNKEPSQPQDKKSPHTKKH